MPTAQPSHRVTVHDLAAGGDGVGRLDDGRVVFIGAAAPDDELDIVLSEERNRFARGTISEVVTPSPHRIEPPCPAVAAGCGGCDWQHLDADAQLDGKIGIVEAALTRIGGLDVPDVGYVAGPEPFGYRTTLRVAVADGRPAMRARSSHDLVAVGGCPVAHPLIEELLADGDFGDAEEVTLRVGSRTGDRVAVVHPAGAVDTVVFPDDVVVVGSRARKGADTPRYREEAAGVTWQISPYSFFQSSPEGADMLVALAAEWLDDRECGTAALVDLYSGVGLFAGTIGDWFDSVTAVESSRTAVADAALNVNAHVTVRPVAAERWTPTLADVVIADPPRTGLRAPVVDIVAATEAPHVVLVSCDAGSLGRDGGLLAAAGYHLDRIDVVDMFPQTSHVEAVTGWVR